MSEGLIERSEHGPAQDPTGDAASRRSTRGFVARFRSRFVRARRVITAVAAIGAVLGGFVGYWNAFRTVSGAGSASFVPVVAQAESTPNRMSIAVLPFANLTGDSSQEYLADAMTEQITSQLAKARGTFVIAYNTAATYKGKRTDAKVIGRELGVRYVLDGSVYRSDDDIVVDTQLVDAATSAVVSSDTLEVKKTQIGNIRRLVAGRLAAALGEALLDAEVKRAQATPSRSLDAQDYVMRATASRNRATSAQELDEAYTLYAKALAIDSRSEPALVGQALVIGAQVSNYSPGRKAAAERLAEAERKATQAISLEPRDPSAHWTLAWIRQLQRRYDEAANANDTALELDPNLVPALALKGWLHTATGRADLGIEPLRQALALSPRDPRRHVWMGDIGLAYMFLANYAESVAWFEKARAVAPSSLEANVCLAAAYAQLGETGRALQAKARVLEIDPDYLVQANSHWYGDAVVRRQREDTLVSGLRKIGFSETKTN